MVFFPLFLATSTSLLVSFGSAYLPAIPYKTNIGPQHQCLYASVGIFYGTSTGNTQDCASKLYDALLKVGVGVAVAEPVDIDSLDSGLLSDVLRDHEALIVGTPTWNTNADMFRSGTGWDDLYYDKLPGLKSILAGKKVAVFGLGDQVSYGENYADAAGELYSVFKDLGCIMMACAHTSQEGYKHKASKSILPDTGKFCGLLLDQINQDDLTDDRIVGWIEQLHLGGFFEESAKLSAPSSVIQQAFVAVDDRKPFDLGTETPKEQPSPSYSTETRVTGFTGSSSFVPHRNLITRCIMWTSPDGRFSYTTSDE